MPTEGQDWISKYEAAKLSGYHPRTLTNMAADGKIAAEMRPLGGKGRVLAWHFRRLDVEALRVAPVQSTES